MNHHQIEKTAASMTIEIRNAVATSLNHSQYDTHENSGRLYCRVRIIERPRMERHRVKCMASIRLGRGV